jgi:hydrogenase nickel incorporation protein HypB
MCTTCGCSADGAVRVSTVRPHSHGDHDHEHEHDHPLDRSHEGEQVPSPANRRTMVLELEVLAKNDGLAASNREWLQRRSITALNLMSSPGSGKTTLLVRTLSDLAGERSAAVIEGDQETSLDANRISATGIPVVQINTGAGCHLDAEMMRLAIDQLNPPDRSLLFVENVGNLVCPALFDLGETAKVVVISVTEGADKPLKYPQMFADADLLIVNKSDLLPYVDFDVSACVRYARQLNPQLPVIVVSATTGAGLEQWYEWLRATASSAPAIG